jgi:hypothetical protein
MTSFLPAPAEPGALLKPQHSERLFRSLRALATGSLPNARGALPAFDAAQAGPPSAVPAGGGTHSAPARAGCEPPRDRPFGDTAAC